MYSPQKEALKALTSERAIQFYKDTAIEHTLTTLFLVAIAADITYQLGRDFRSMHDQFIVPWCHRQWQRAMQGEQKQLGMAEPDTLEVESETLEVECETIEVESETIEGVEEVAERASVERVIGDDLNIEQMTIRQLKKVAQELKIKRYSYMTKAELREAIEQTWKEEGNQSQN